MKTDYPAPGRVVRGKSEMRQLAMGAFIALEQADLADLVADVHARLFTRAPEDLLDVELVDGVWQWRFKPMVELLLRHIRDVAANAALPLAERQREIAWAVGIVGF
jgi:hypothetical protein